MGGLADYINSIIVGPTLQMLVTGERMRKPIVGHHPRAMVFNAANIKPTRTGNITHDRCQIKRLKSR